MTTHDYGAAAPTAGSPGSGGTADQAQQAATTAKEEGRHVADVAKGEAQQVMGEAQRQARNLMDEARTQVEAQSRSQLDSLVTMLQGFADDLEQMARGDGAEAGLAQDVVTQVSDQAKSLSSRIQGREPGEILDQVRAFARRRPGTFLLGALAAGVVAGRLTRGAKDAHSSESSAQVTAPTGTAGIAGTAASDPLAGTTAPPPVDPVYPEGTESNPSAWGTPASPQPTLPPPAPGVDPARGTP